MGNGELIFFGSPEICIPFLVELKKKFHIALIITQPDAEGGRSRKKMIPAVKPFAEANGIPVIQPDNLREPEVIERVKLIHPDLGVVISYGRMIPRSLYTIPLQQTINVHFSLLPKYRGAAPLQRAIENGDTLSGITVFEITSDLDAGDIWSQKEVPILVDETYPMVLSKMAAAGSSFLSQTIEQIHSGALQKQVQDHRQATWAPAIKKEEGRIAWTHPARQIYNKLRAFAPWPGLYFSMDHRLIKVKKASVSALNHNQAVGTVYDLSQLGLNVCCGQNSILEIQEIQPEGKKPMRPFDYSLGNPIPNQLL